MPSKHAILSPSSASRWMACPGSVALSRGLPDSSSAYADEGTRAHELAATILEFGDLPIADSDMLAFVSVYVDLVRDIAGEHGILLVEQELPIEHITGEKGAVGTSDAVILLEDEIVIVDLKYGRGVEVSAEDNSQLKIYALAALKQYEMLGDFKRVRLVISQPRITSAPSEWDITVEELKAWAAEVRKAADLAMSIVEPGMTFLSPGDEQCKFCRAKYKCPALAKKVQDEVGAEFDVIAQPGTQINTEGMSKEDDADLATKMAACDLIEEWIKAVRAEVERRLLAGGEVPGYKLVEGKKGARKWAQESDVEEYLKKSVRLPAEQMYDMKLISPTSAEKLFKAKALGPKQWEKLQEWITQSNGAAHVAPASDKRPALQVKPVVDEFSDITAEALL